MEQPIKFPLGQGPLATALVALMLFGVAGYFGYAGWADLSERTELSGGFVLEREAGRLLFYALAAGALLAGGYLTVRSLRNLGNEKAVLLDANRIVMTGLDASGEDRIMAFAEIERVTESRTRGIDVVELTSRDGTKIALGSIQFRAPDQFEQFRAELRRRLPRQYG